MHEIRTAVLPRLNHNEVSILLPLQLQRFGRERIQPGGGFGAVVTVVGEGQVVEVTFVRVGEGVVVWDVAVRGDVMDFVFDDGGFGFGG